MGSTKILLLGVVLGLIAAVLAYTQVEDEEPVAVGQAYMKLNADVNLAAGDKLLPEMISAVTIPLEFKEVQSVAVKYTGEVKSWLGNNDVRVSRDVLAGSFILHEHLLDDPEVRFANIISEKGRAISIPASEISSVSYFIEPGSKIDILATLSLRSTPSLANSTGFAAIPGALANPANPNNLSNQANRIVTRTILQNMHVLAVGRSTTRNAYLNSNKGYGSITLDVTAEEAEILTFLMNQSEGGFNLVLRNPSNTSEQEIDDVDWQTVTSRK